jgi:hypothetical protein
MIEYITIFLFVFSLIVFLNAVYLFIRSVISNPPKKLSLNWREKIVYGMSLSYIITFLILK